MKKGILIVLLVMLGTVMINYIGHPWSYRIKKTVDNSGQMEAFLLDVAKTANEAGVQVMRDGDLLLEDEIGSEADNVYISDKGVAMLSLDLLEQLFGCVVYEQSEKEVLVICDIIHMYLEVDNATALVNNGYVSFRDKVQKKGDTIYLPIEDASRYLYLDCEYALFENILYIDTDTELTKLPVKYDLRNEDKVSVIRDQGESGTCWAIAALAAMESVALPEEELAFAVDHMWLESGFETDYEAGGDSSMSVAYLASWKGPVLESDDPFGDQKTDTSLSAVKHLEEAVFLENKDYQSIKEYVYYYGGVQTSIYINTVLQNEEGESPFYNFKTASLYYDGRSEANHDVVIVGWDDQYPKENFATEPEADGAFICQNSWGDGFGDEGYIYVSYYDSRIGTNNAVYTKVADTDNFDNIYQTDLLGWVGQLGFEAPDAYFANVYESKGKESLEAVSFYTTDVNSSYRVYVVQDYKDEDSLNDRTLVAEGSFVHSGYYTVQLDAPVSLEAGEQYAVVVYIDTPGSLRPVAIEYVADNRTSTADTTDGVGFISLYGEEWTRVEYNQNANICLKAFTNNEE